MSINDLNPKVEELFSEANTEEVQVVKTESDVVLDMGRCPIR